MITAKQLLTVFPKCRDANITAKLLGRVAEEFGITSKNAFAAFVANCGHESGSFKVLRENLSYSLPGLRRTWPGRFTSDEAAAPYERQPEKLANFVYANRMGNGPVESKDGWRYRGGGWIQLTGKENYAKADETLKRQLVLYPQRIEQPEVAARSAGWFWASKGLTPIAEEGQFEEVCRRINGGLTGFTERALLCAKLHAVLP